MDFSFSLNTKQLNKLFPYYLLINKKMDIISCSKAITEIYGREIKGKNFFSIFDLINSNIVVNCFEDFKKLNQKKTNLINFSKAPSKLIGHFEFLQKDERVLFVGEAIKKKVKETSHKLISNIKNDDIANYENVLNENKDAFYRIDLSGKILIRNYAAELIQLVKFNGRDYNINDFLKHLSQNVSSSKNQLSFEINSNKKIYNVLCNVNKRKGFINIYTSDITELKYSNQKLELFSLILKKIQSAVIIINAEQKVEWVNDSFEKITGFGSQEVMGKISNTFLVRNQTDVTTIDYIKSKIEKFEEFNCDLYSYRKNNEGYWCRIVGYSVIDRLDSEVKYIVILKDITLEKKPELELKNQKKFTENIINNIPADIAVFDKDQKYLFVNPLGIKDEETRKWIIGKDDFDYCKLKNLDNSLALKRRELFNVSVKNKSKVELIDEHNTSDGKKKFILRCFYPIFESNELRFVIGYGIDVTSIKLSEIQNRELIEEKSNILESIEDGFINIDSNSHVSYWNHNIEDLTEIKKEIIVGQNIEQFIRKEKHLFLNFLFKKIRKCIIDKIDNFELFIPRKEVWVEIKIYSSAKGLSLYVKNINARKKTEAELKDFDNKLNKSIIKAQEDERYDIGSELHDNICQILVSIKMGINMLRKVVNHGDDYWLKYCFDNVSQVLTETRNLSHRLSPLFISKVSFKASLEELIANYNFMGDYQIQLNLDSELADYLNNNNIQLNLFRIIQEQLNNIRKHAKATIIKINIKLEDQLIITSIEDNGIGFNFNSTKLGNGLMNIKRRTDLLNGELRIKSNENKGCEILVLVPLEQNG